MKVREVKNTEKIKERERIHEQKDRDRFATKKESENTLRERMMPYKER